MKNEITEGLIEYTEKYLFPYVFKLCPFLSIWFCDMFPRILRAVISEAAQHKFPAGIWILFGIVGTLSH